MVDHLQRDDGVRSMSDLSQRKKNLSVFESDLSVFFANQDHCQSLRRQQYKNKHISNLTSCRTNNKSLHIQRYPEGISLNEHLHNISS